MFVRLYLQKIKSLILEVFALIIKEAITIQSDCIADIAAKHTALLVLFTNKG